MKKPVLLAAVAAFALALPAFTASGDETYTSSTKIKKSTNGNYSEDIKAEKTDASGTTTAGREDVDISTNPDGSTKRTVKTQSSVDPKGLFNKHTTKTKDTTETSANGNVKTIHKKVVDGRTVESNSNTTE